MRLWEIDSRILELIERGFTEDCVDMETGELDSEKIQEYLINLPIERDKKLDAYGCLIKNLTAGVEAIKAEETALKARRQAKERMIERLQASVVQSLVSQGQREYETARVAFSLRKSESVEITSISSIPKQYIKEKVEYSADKNAIKNAIKSGEVIEGASIVTNQNLQIK